MTATVRGGLIALTFALLAATSALAQQVVASTAWTGAFASAAGAEDIAVLAPFDLAHPPEYELRPSDIRTIANADLVIYAGYENMVERLLEAAGGGEATALQIQTVHSLPVLTSSIMAIAKELGTEAEASATLDSIRELFSAWRVEVAGYALGARPVAVHFHQQALARELGMNVVAVFGPAPLEAREIDEITKAEPVLIIDNGHNPVAAPIAETTEAPVAVWYNFPGIDGTRTLFDIFELNRRRLARAME